MQQSITNTLRERQTAQGEQASTKLWSYAEITAATEKSIQTGIELARRHPAGTSERRFQGAVVWGIYWGWCRLTFGCQMQGDAERLKKLAEEV